MRLLVLALAFALALVPPRAAAQDVGAGQGTNTNSGAGAGAGAAGAAIPDGYTAPVVPPPLHVAPQLAPRWRAAHRKAAAHLAGWSVAERVWLVTGAGWMVGRCVGNIAPNVPRAFPGLCLQDSPLGVRFAELVSAFPAAINAAAT